MRDQEEIEDFLSRVYARVRFRAVDDRPELAWDRLDAGAVCLDRVAGTSHLDVHVDELPALVLVRNRTARQRIDRGDSTTAYAEGDLFIQALSGQPYEADAGPGTVDTTVVDYGLLDRVAGSADDPGGEQVRFLSTAPQTASAAAQWWATRTFVAQLLRDSDMVTPLMVDAAAQLLAAATLVTFPNTAVTDPSSQDRHDAHQATLRRAIAFIDEHAHREIAVADVAAAASVTVRAVQLAFRRHLNTTPTAYLRRVRLARAHEELRAGDPTTATVTAIGRQWGFGSSSRFATTYRAAYGQSPSRTLRT